MILSFPDLPFLTLKTREGEEDYAVRSHSHREVSLGLIRSGETRITMGGRDFLLRRGDSLPGWRRGGG